jgi:hypothetical protein
MKLLLEKIQCEKYNLNLCGDLKLVALFLDLQLRCTKFCCFLCEWDSRERKTHFIHKQWTERESLIPGEKNVVNTPLINPAKVYLPSLQRKLGLIKNGFKTMDQKSAGFVNLKTKCPTMSDTKIKERIFVGLQIRELIQDVKYEDQLSELKRAAWKILKNGTTNFFGKSQGRKSTVIWWLSL